MLVRWLLITNLNEPMAVGTTMPSGYTNARDILTVSKSLACKAGAEVRRGSISGTHLI